ncbi:MAG: hypothetical protein Kow00109_00280 [Acidobacteriota bacterium]
MVATGDRGESLGRVVASSADGCVLRVHVQPNAKRSSFAGLHGDALKIKVAAPAVEDRANRELEAFLARCLGLRKNEVQVVSGRRGRDKLLQIQGLSREELARRVLQYIR